MASARLVNLLFMPLALGRLKYPATKRVIPSVIISNKVNFLSLLC